jgi:arylsulfatase A-like enzyme
MNGIMKTIKSTVILFIFVFFLLECIAQTEATVPNTINNFIKKKTDRPNIIFILTDDQRWDAIGYAGNPLAFTPQMNKLAEEGVFFKNTIATTPICSASRASILSGLQERTHKYSFQTADIKDEYMQNAFPKLLRDAGYYTAMYGKFGVSYTHLDVLFDDYEEYDLRYDKKDRSSYYYKTIDKDTVHLTRYTGYKALQFLDNVPTDKPFCLQLSFSAPHASDNTKEQYFWDQANDHVLKDVTVPAASLGEQKYYDSLPNIVKDGFNRLRWGWRYDTPEKYQHSVKGYYRMIAGIDYEIEKIREKLKAQGLDKNTVIILMGDNGQFLGERQIAGKWLMYDNSIKVPLMIFDPRVKKQHKDVEAMALNVDIPATILDLAELEIPKSWHGKSLMPFIRTENASLNRDAILIEHLWEFDKIPPSEGVRTNKWKYFRYVNDKSIEELYDLEKDPKEIVNLAKNQKYASVLQELQTTCDALIAQHKDPYSSIATSLNINFSNSDEKALSTSKNPIFGWEVPKEAVFQSAFQILVASSKENLDKNIGDAWNSGQVRIKSSTNNVYQGKPLRENVNYFWKVRIWDTDNRLSEYSKESAFQIVTNYKSIPNSINNSSSTFSSSNASLDAQWHASKVAATEDPSFDESKLTISQAYCIQLRDYVFDTNYSITRNTIEKFMETLSTKAEDITYISLMLLEDYMYTGNNALIQKYYQQIKKVTNLNQLQKDGLLLDEHKKKTMVVNAYHYKNLELLSKFAQLLDEDSDLLQYDLQALMVKKAIQKSLLNEKGVFIDVLGSKTTSVATNILALAFNLVPKENRSIVINYITMVDLKEVQDSEFLFLMQSLFDADETELSAKLLQKQSTKGGTTQGTIKIPAIVVSRNLWGIQPKTPGFSAVSIHPKLTGLQNSSILLPTAKGLIKGTYEYLSFRKQIYTIALPSTMIGTFEMEFSKEHIVKVNGKKIATSFGSLRLMPGINTIELIVNTF